MIWDIGELIAAKRARGESSSGRRTADRSSFRRVPDAIDMCRTPPRPSGPRPTRVSVLRLHANQQECPEPIRRTLI